MEIGARCRLRDCVLMRGVKVGNSSLVSGSILGWGSKVGDWSRLEGCVLGQDCAAKVGRGIECYKANKLVDLAYWVGDKYRCASLHRWSGCI